jgi:hypothetical protein
MNLPPSTREDRRTVPRHLRDSEHDITDMAPGAGMRGEDAGGSRRLRGWVYVALAALVVAMSLWIGLSAG